MILYNKGVKMSGNIDIQMTLNEKDVNELISLLKRTEHFAKEVIQWYKLDGTNDEKVARMSFDASGHLYQSSGYLINLFKDMGVIPNDK